MNPIITDLPIKSQTEIHGEAKQKQEFKFLGTIRLKPGLKLYSLNTKTIELKEVEVKKTKDVNFNGEEVKNDHALYNPDCIYFQALNQTNAERKASKVIMQFLDKK